MSSRSGDGGNAHLMDTWIAAGVFLVAYALIASERYDRTLIALLGGLLLIVVGVIDQDEAFGAIDFNVIFLLAGMMVLASALGRTGFFAWLAIHSVRMSRGDPLRLLIILASVTAILSAFLDNVTTVVLMTPIILSVARRLGVSPVPYLISGILASNIGGTATLIGDPPNILIGSAAGLGFGAFLANLLPVVLLIFAVFLLTMVLLFRGALQVPDERREAALEATEEKTIPDRGLLIRTLVVVGCTMVAFVASSALGLQPATIALLGATVLMLVGGLDPHEMFRDVEWSTLFFFVGLFILVEAVVRVGIVGGIANAIADAVGHDVGLAAMAVLWFSAIASAIIDNIPYTATAIPVVQHLVAGGLPPDALWWSLALGACLGGNLTIVGASANVVVANLALRSSQPIRFGEFLRYGGVVVAESLVISSVYVWLRYVA
jgi:Na+/H+ antiporter NhaD/arsenite permease-like protein